MLFKDRPSFLSPAVSSSPPSPHGESLCPYSYSYPPHTADDEYNDSIMPLWLVDISGSQAAGQCWCCTIYHGLPSPPPPPPPYSPPHPPTYTHTPNGLWHGTQASGNSLLNMWMRMLVCVGRPVDWIVQFNSKQLYLIKITVHTCYDYCTKIDEYKLQHKLLLTG